MKINIMEYEDKLENDKNEEEVKEEDDEDE